MAEKISPEQIDHIAKLARLSLEGEVATSYAAELTAILGYVAKLQAAPLKVDEQLVHASGLVNQLQDDDPAIGLDQAVQREQFLAAAPAADGQYLKVKAILEG